VRIGVLMIVLALAGCVNYGQSVMVSKGQAGVVQSVFGTQGQFCKLTASEGVTITDQDREAFTAFCGQN